MPQANYYELVGFTGHDHGPTAVELPTVDLSKSALFLDFDGTLVDIAETPDSIAVPDGLQGLLEKLLSATGGALAIVSGRPVETISGYLPDFRGAIIGSHGSERLHEGRFQSHHLADCQIVENMYRMMSRFAETKPGLRVERKPTGCVMHYRQNPDAEDSALKFVQALEHSWPDFSLHVAKMAYELRPNDVSKDRAVAELLETEPFVNRTPIYFGDDNTDEPALSLVSQSGGIAVRVGEADTRADYRISDPAEVRRVLERWIR